MVPVQGPLTRVRPEGSRHEVQNIPILVSKPKWIRKKRSSTRKTAHGAIAKIWGLRRLNIQMLIPSPLNLAVLTHPKVRQRSSFLSVRHPRRTVMWAHYMSVSDRVLVKRIRHIQEKVGTLVLKGERKWWTERRKTKKKALTTYVTTIIRGHMMTKTVLCCAVLLWMSPTPHSSLY